MARTIRFAAAISLSLVAAAPLAQGKPEPIDPRCTELLPIAEMQKLIGVKPLELVGRFEVKYMAGTCNYVTGSGKQPVLMFSVSRATPTAMEEYKQVARTTGGATPLSGLGDEALKSSGSIFFRKGETAASVASFLDPATLRHRVSDEKLLTAAKALAKKL